MLKVLTNGTCRIIICRKCLLPVHAYALKYGCAGMADIYQTPKRHIGCAAGLIAHGAHGRH